LDAAARKVTGVREGRKKKIRQPLGSKKEKKAKGCAGEGRRRRGAFSDCLRLAFAIPDIRKATSRNKKEKNREGDHEQD